MPTVGVFAAIFDEHNRILCVKRAYGPQNWTTPGGRMESAESPVEALEREVEEETGYVVQATRILGVYSATFKDDLVLSIEAKIVSRREWHPSEEISELGFFTQDELPEPMHSSTLARVRDAFAGTTGIIRVFREPHG